MFSHTSQPCTFERDCDVVMIPAGDTVTIPAGTVGYITQALGGSFTVFVDGNLFRVAGVDADAIGKQPVMPPSLPENATDDDVENAKPLPPPCHRRRGVQVRLQGHRARAAQVRRTGSRDALDLSRVGRVRAALGEVDGLSAGA